MLPAGTVMSTSGGMTRLIWTESLSVCSTMLVPETVIVFTPCASGMPGLDQLCEAAKVPEPPVRLLVHRMVPVTTWLAVP